MNRIKHYEKIASDNYLFNLCELYFKKLFQEDDNQPLKAYECEIWMIGSELLEIFKGLKKTAFTNELLQELLKIINTQKFGRGRESFVMLLHYFKNQQEVEICLSSLLNDPLLYAFAISEMTRLKLFNYTDKVEELLANETIGWRRQTAKKYLEKAKLPQ